MHSHSLETLRLQNPAYIVCYHDGAPLEKLCAKKWTDVPYINLTGLGEIPESRSCQKPPWAAHADAEGTFFAPESDAQGSDVPAT